MKCELPPECFYSISVAGFAFPKGCIYSFNLLIATDLGVDDLPP